MPIPPRKGNRNAGQSREKPALVPKLGNLLSSFQVPIAIAFPACHDFCILKCDSLLGWFLMTETAVLSLAEAGSFAILIDTSDAEFLTQIPWNSDADAELIEVAQLGNLKSFWDVLTHSEFGLGARANRKKVRERRDSAALSLWSRGGFEESPREKTLAECWSKIANRVHAENLAQQSHQTKKKNQSAREKTEHAVPSAIKIPRRVLGGLTTWLETTPDVPPSAWELLMLTELLRQAGGSLSAKVGVPLWRRVLMAANDWGTSAETDSPSPHSGMSEGELPWVLGLLLAHVRGSETLRERGRSALHSLLEENTDTDGTLLAEKMEIAPMWLSPIVRAAEWAFAAEVPLWNESQTDRFSYLINRMAGCFAGDGHLPFDPPSGQHALPLLLTAARLAGGSKREWPLKFLWDVAEAQPGLLTASGPQKHSAKLKTSRRRPVEVETDWLVQQSDWAHMACLRNHAGRDADVCVVTHHRSLPLLDLSILGNSVIQGAWELEVLLDQEPLELPDNWSCVCWHTDADGDYLELQHAVDENIRVERQVFLSRTEHLLMLADCISGVGDRVIDYTSRLPLAESAKFLRHETSRECQVQLPNAVMRTFPLALPDDLVQSTPGRWGLSKDLNRPCLELHQTSKGGLYAPLVFEWTPARQNSYADWRTLTITEDGPKVGCEKAAGHRLRIGNQQLLIYRSLALNGELRTVLGHHTGHETIIGRFNKNGDVKPLLIVE